MRLRKFSAACSLALLPMLATAGDNKIDIGKLYTGEFRVEQSDLANMTLAEKRLAGLRMFTNPFLKSQGFGDGDDNPPSPSATGNHEGERGTLQGNGSFQRINGLDAQACLECHSVISRRKVPFTTGIGGVGGINNTVLGAGGGTLVDLKTADKKGNINGRVINPPFIFGAGGIELLANEMTIALQKQLAAAPAGATTPLSAKGVSFGSITKNAYGDVVVERDGSAVGVEGTFRLNPRNADGSHNEDFLVVAPFGRKGDAKSTRDFDTAALSFHFGMAVDEGFDHDDDGVVNEVLEGELSVLSILVGTAQTPFAKTPEGAAIRGRHLIDEIGCTGCHIPSMETKTKFLGFRSPEVANDPTANVHTNVNLARAPMSFPKNGIGGVTVELFADLKRHYMGENMEEFNGDGMFTTMRLWGVADTAPYLHDGRAFTIKDAIQTHGLDPASEAFTAVSNFNNLSESDQNALLAFLDTLRSPNGTFPRLLNRIANEVALEQGVTPN